MAKNSSESGGQNDLQSALTCWKSPEMDELDLVLSQDMREINCECVVFECGWFEDDNKNANSDQISTKISIFCSFLCDFLHYAGSSGFFLNFFHYSKIKIFKKNLEFTEIDIILTPRNRGCV